MDNLLTDLQGLVAGKLADDYPTAGPGQTWVLDILTEDDGDILYGINKAIAEIGISTIVMTPKMQITGRAPNQVEVDVVIQITENVTINRSGGAGNSGIPAGDLGVQCVVSLMRWTPDPDIWTPFLFQHLMIHQMKPLIYEAAFKTNTILQTVVDPG